MGAGDFHGRVRDGIGCRLPAKATRSSKLSNNHLSEWQRRVIGGAAEVLVLCVIPPADNHDH